MKAVNATFNQQIYFVCKGGIFRSSMTTPCILSKNEQKNGLYVVGLCVVRNTTDIK